jgi:DNA mismatch repair protein MSH4
MKGLLEQEAGCFTTFARSIALLSDVARANVLAQLCAPENIVPIQELVDSVINEDTTYAKQPLELRNQRTYAVNSGVNGLLDVARTTYKEAMEDAYEHASELSRKTPIFCRI